MVCQNWAAQIAPNRPEVMALYWAKYLFVYIGGWAFFVSFNADYPGFSSPVEWAFNAVSFRKAVAWSLCYEMLGIGCSWGPMNGRFKPMTGGLRYFLRPGTTKMPWFPGAPLIGGATRTWLEPLLYAVLQLSLLRALVAPEVTASMLWPAWILIAVLGVLDTTIFLAARSEHYWVALTCLVAASSQSTEIAGYKLVWCFIWFWAATSKINSHFPSVIMFMMNNGPFFPKRLKTSLFADYPNDLRPSAFAARMAHGGTVIEYMIPVVLLLSPNATVTVLGLCMMTSFHGFIALNNPNGMPIEWNIMMIYGGWFLFLFEPAVGLSALTASPLLLAFLLFWLLAIPTVGNFFPSKVSFLLAMRYYAGNWAYNIWLFRKNGKSVAKLDKLVKSTPPMREQLKTFDLDDDALEMAMSLTMSSRFMHFEGRPLLEALPRAVDDIDNYEWFEGEVFGGSVIGWNFGDGHLNGKKLLDLVQPQCGFEPGEVRLVSVESQPLFTPTMHWKVWDAATGLVAEGVTELHAMREQQPWPTGQYAEALAGENDGS